MHVLMTVHGQPEELIGGTERHVETLAAAVRRRGHQVSIVSGSLSFRAGEVAWQDERRADGVLIRRLLRGDIHFEEWNKTYEPTASRAFGQLLDELRPDVVHVHHWLRLTTDQVRQSWRRGIPSVVSIHDYSTSCPIHHRILMDGAFCSRPPGPDVCADCLARHTRPWSDGPELARGLALREADFANEFNLANLLAPLSQDLLDGLGELGRPATDRMVVQPFASGLQLRRAPAPDPFATPLRILNLGRVTPLKGQQILLQAVAATADPQAYEVHLAGPCDDFGDRRWIEDLATGLRVVFRNGYEYADLEREAYHLAVLPSVCRETYGLVLDEVQGLGLPAFCSAFGAYPERLGAGGATFPVGEVRGLAALLDRAAQDRGWLQQLRDGVPEPRSFGALVDFFEAVYGRAVAEGPRDVEDQFDAEGHLIDLAQRVDLRERALWASTAGDPPVEPVAASPAE